MRTKTRATPRKKPKSKPTNVLAVIPAKPARAVKTARLAMMTATDVAANAAAAVAARAEAVTVKAQPKDPAKDRAKVPAKVRPKAKIVPLVMIALTKNLQAAPKAQCSLLAKATKRAPPQTTTVPAAAAAAGAEAATATVMATVTKLVKLWKLVKLLKAKLPKAKLAGKSLLAIPKLLLKLPRKLRLLK